MQLFEARRCVHEITSKSDESRTHRSIERPAGKQSLTQRIPLRRKWKLHHKLGIIGKQQQLQQANGQKEDLHS